MADHFEYEEDFETDDFDIKKNESEIYDENDDQMINSFEDLPVKIEFVLGKKIMNLYEIDELCAKRIISLLPESEKNIKIRVNGALTGWICPYISRHLLSLNPLQARCRRYSRGER